MIGRPHLHLRETPSTNDRARELAAAGAPHGTIVTAARQTMGRGRQGRTWSAPPGGARPPPPRARRPRHCSRSPRGWRWRAWWARGAALKWPNDVLLADGRKVAGILVEGRLAEGWAVVGIGVNVAVREDDLPPELRGRAASLGLPAAELDAFGSRCASPSPRPWPSPRRS